MGKLQKKESWLQRWMKKQGWTHHRRFIGLGIQSIIMAVLTALTLITTITIGLLLYNRFKMAMKQTAVSNAESMVESTVDKLDAELLNVRQIMNAVNYNIIQENDISSDEFNRQFSLLYEINTDKVQSMALYDSDGAQLVAEPVSERKKGVKASKQDWYTNAEEEIENVHFSLPHIQNLFEDGTYRYYWVISLSRSVDINDGEKPRSGVLLVDMKYSVISNTMKRINESSNGIYYYLCSRDGQMIYHPRRADIDRGYFSENCEMTSQLEDGTYELSLNGRPGNVLYDEFLEPETVSPLYASKLINIIFRRKLVCFNKGVRAVIVTHQELEEVQRVPIVNGEAYVEILSNTASIIFEDSAGNRYAGSIPYRLERIVDENAYMDICCKYSPRDYRVLLHNYEQLGDFTFKKAIEVNAARDIVNCDEISYDYKQQAYLNIIEYYHENLDNEVLTKYLEKLDIEYLNHANARVMIAYMVDMNMFDKAFQAVKLYGFDEIDSEELYRLADYGVEDSNGFLNEDLLYPSVQIR